MGVYIRDINLPDKFGSIKLEIFSDGGVWINMGGRYREIPNAVIQIPTPHGELKDVDAIKEKLKDQIPATGLDMTYKVSNAFDEINRAPVILEIEE